MVLLRNIFESSDNCGVILVGVPTVKSNARMTMLFTSHNNKMLTREPGDTVQLMLPFNLCIMYQID